MAYDFCSEYFGSLNVAEMIERGDEFFLVQHAVICGADVKNNLAKIINAISLREDYHRFAYLVKHYIDYSVPYEEYSSLISKVECYKYFEDLCATLNIAKMIRRGDEILLIKFAMLCGAKTRDYIDEIFEATMTREDFVEVLKLLNDFGIKFDSEIAVNSAYIAIKNNYLDYAEFLIENGADSCGLLKVILNEKKQINL